MEGKELDLPGFRFHPTEEELLDFYLRRVVYGKKLNFAIIGTLNLYLYDPWDLPGKAKIGEREWYFFVPRDRKHSNGGRPNRTTERGFWKATGSDRHIRSTSDPKRLIGLKKTLVFYEGRAPRGTKTDWVMNEYRLPESNSSSCKEDIVLCKIYRKATSLKELEQRAAMEEVATASQFCPSESTDVFPLFPDHDNFQKVITTTILEDDEEQIQEMKEEVMKKEMEEEEEASSSMTSSVPSSVTERAAKRNFPELELQVPNNNTVEWMQESFLNQLRSPWMMELWSPYANLLNF